MSETAVSQAATSETHGADHGHDDHAHHPTERQYWMIFVVLAILTAIEVASAAQCCWRWPCTQSSWLRSSSRF